MKLVKIINSLRPTKEQAEEMPPHYSFGYVDAINAVIESVKKLDVADVASSALKDDERLHYEALQDCCKGILKDIDSGKVPRGIMGLRLLLER